MKVTGFTFIRNAITFDYPVVEAITSILPVCDEFIVSVGNSDDDTRGLIERINSSKIKIIDSIWDDSLREGGKVLALETDKVFDQITKETDWCFYIQADEVVHEKYHPEILDKMNLYLNDNIVEGLLFNYTHFYGSYNYVADSRNWYRNEIRIIRNDKTIRSYRDAQGFRKEGRKLQVKPINAFIYHYGWVKNPIYQKRKEKYFHKFWHSDNWIGANVKKGNEFDYSIVDSLTLFKHSHPLVMQKRVATMDWKFDFDIRKKQFSLKKWLLYFYEKLTGVRLFEYRNFKII
ncbi:MAG: glycosyltransferase family 2 protein [Bacteroidota bacterium]|nr:glycosyltransferase family 2 protein [Bacteroidota bacterium]